MNDGGFPLSPASRDTELRDQRDRETWHQIRSARKLPPPWSEGDRLGDFVLQQLLGQGSSGYVYRAQDEVSGRTCALKLICVEEPKELVRLKLGFRRMMTINAPGLLRVDRIHQLGDQLALSMEEIEGTTFREFAARLPGMDSGAAYAELLRLVRDYASALAVMHAHGYVHRDIKPANLMIDGMGRAVVIDYGLVGTFDPEMDPSGARDYFVGTPMYVAPEVLWNQFHGPASDIFSLGMVLLEAIQRVTGRPHLARSESSRSEDLKVLGESLQGLSEQVPETLRDACAEMLEFDPGDRPTAGQIARLGLPASAIALPSLRPPIYGREEELTRARAWVDSIFAGGTGRLHITGPSGIGKTRLLEEILAAIEAKRWGQVFHARCRRREDEPMQAFGQITDAIVARYSRGDREAMQVDPVSHSMLTMAFPSLAAVVEADMERLPVKPTSTRLDALEAASRLSVELRRIGPLILIIDDVQWADRDSINVLDRLQTAPGGMLGLITVSRDGVDRQQVAASETLRLQPLEAEHGLRMLLDASRRWRVEVDPELLRELVESADGCPYRLVELIDEFRPGGVLAEAAAGGEGSGLAPVTEFDQILHRRMERLSHHARRVLRLIATAGRPVSLEQLAELSSLGDSVEAAVSELVQQRLVIDEATGGECISVVHDRVTDQLIQTLDPNETRHAHRQWSRLLMRADRPEELAARIAKHLTDAGEPGRAVSYAMLAAEDAERRLATTEAAYWHQRVIPYVNGRERIDRVRRAARCFDRANRPIEAARLYRQLAELVEGPERLDHELLSLTLEIRSGHLREVRERLDTLARQLRAPRGMSPLRGRLTLAAGAIRFRRARSSLWRMVTHVDPTRLSATDVPRPIRQRIRLCLSIDRSMAMFDNLLALRMNAAGLRDALRYGQADERLYAAIGAAVFGCYDSGRLRVASELVLQQLHDPVLRLADPKLLADLWAAIAISHACSCRWYRTLGPVRRGVEQYRTISDHYGFEIAHTRWVEIWACFHLGRLRTLARVTEEVLDEAIHHRDRFAEMMGTFGFGGASWLMRDDIDGLTDARARLPIDRGTGQPELIHVFDWFSELQALLYGGQWEQAEERLNKLGGAIDRLPFSKLQMLRVHRWIFSTLLALRRVSGSEERAEVEAARRAIRRLRREDVPFATTAADLFEGLLLRRLGQHKEAIERLREARAGAAEAYLRPWQCAAEDALAGLECGRDGDRLLRRLESEGVVCPLRFARLYTVREGTEDD